MNQGDFKVPNFILNVLGRKLISAFVFAYAKSRISHDEAQIIMKSCCVHHWRKETQDIN